MKDSEVSPAAGELGPDHLVAVVSLLKKAGREVELEIRGNSMGSTIPDRSQIRVRAVEGEDYRVGQVVAFIVGQSLVVHRVVYCGEGERLGRYLLTQGDGWLLCDSPRARSSILGVVAEFSHGGEWQALPSQAARSAADQRKAERNVAFIRRCMKVSVLLAHRVAGTLLALNAFLRPLRSRNARRT